MEILVYLLAIALISCASAVPLDDSGSRISDGINAAENQFPYAISLQETSGMALPTRGHRCGGALITLSHALTTASCVHTEVNNAMVMLNPAEHRVFAGSALLTNDNVADRVRAVANFTVHPNYTGPPAFVHDIAIITVIAPFLTTTVTPLALPAATFNPPDFSLCQVAGWGAPNNTLTASTQLQFANMYVYNQELCTTLYNSMSYMPNIRTTMVCAVSYNILSSGCINDNGNALVCDGTLTGVLFLTDNCRGSSLPELYTRVSNYTTWIRSISASPALFNPGVFMLTALFSIAQLFLIK